MWDQTLIFDEITLYGPPELVQQNPPECVVEIFDKDMIVSCINLSYGTQSLCYLCNQWVIDDAQLTECIISQQTGCCHTENTYRSIR